MATKKTNIGKAFYSVLSEENAQNEVKNEEKRMRAEIKTLKDERNTHNQRIITIDEQIEKLEKELAVLTFKNATQQASEDTSKEPVNQKYIKEYFVIGDSNKAAIRSIENTVNSNEAQNNPLILYGASGTGKTHVANMVAVDLRKLGKSVYQLSALDFIDRLVVALSNQEEDEFRRELNECVVLIIDDLQHFTDRFGSQDELCLILDERLASGKQTIFTANEHPKDMDWHNHNLASRLLSGLNVKIELADEAMQLQILTKRLESANIILSQEILAKAVNNTKGNGWLIEGVAKQIIDLSLQGIEINQETLAQNLQI